ncbi:unnamed protein product, partial [Polarella glacialis]
MNGAGGVGMGQDYRQQGPPSDYGADYGGYGPVGGQGAYGQQPPQYGQQQGDYQDYPQHDDRDHPGHYDGPGGNPNPMGTYNNDAMASGVAGAYGSVIDMNTYQQYTESGKGSGRREGMQKIDPDSGIAPRRCTDLVCVAIFAIYCLMMIVVLWVVKSREVGDHPYSDIRRLTHGMDYKARLCGIDPGVEEKPFLFFCRATPSDGNFAVVSADQKGNLLNLGHPICVESCPTWSNLTDGGKTQKGPYLVECLMPESTLKEPIIKKNPAGNMPFGIVESYFFVVKEETMQTITYSTHLLAGRYCLPTNSTLKAKIVGLTGPLSPAKRLHLSIGSYGDCWGVMFGVAFMSVCLSYLYVFVIGRVKNAAKKVVNTTLTLVYILFVLAGVFFLAAILNYVPEVSGTPFMKYYMGKNTFFERDSQTDATVTSTVLGALCASLRIQADSTIAAVRRVQMTAERQVAGFAAARTRAEELSTQAMRRAARAEVSLEAARASAAAAIRAASEAARAETAAAVRAANEASRADAAAAIRAASEAARAETAAAVRAANEASRADTAAAIRAARKAAQAEAAAAIRRAEEENGQLAGDNFRPCHWGLAVEGAGAVGDMVKFKVEVNMQGNPQARQVSKLVPEVVGITDDVIDDAWAAFEQEDLAQEEVSPESDPWAQAEQAWAGVPPEKDPWAAAEAQSQQPDLADVADAWAAADQELAEEEVEEEEEETEPDAEEEDSTGFGAESVVAAAAAAAAVATASGATRKKKKVAELSAEEQAQNQLTSEARFLGIHEAYLTSALKALKQKEALEIDLLNVASMDNKEYARKSTTLARMTGITEKLQELRSVSQMAVDAKEMASSSDDVAELAEE